MKFSVGDRVLGAWPAIDVKRPVQGWCGTVREVLPGGRVSVAFPPYGKDEYLKSCKPSELRMAKR